MNILKAKRRPTDVEVLHRLFTESDREVATEYGTGVPYSVSYRRLTTLLSATSLSEK